MMTHRQYRNALARLDLTQVGAASVLGINPRTSRRYAEIGNEEMVIPTAIEVALKAMLTVRKQQAALDEATPRKKKAKANGRKKDHV